LLVALSKFAQCERFMSFMFLVCKSFCLTRNHDFGSFKKFAPKRRSLQYQQTQSALRIKFEDNPDFGLDLDPRVSLRRVALKDL
jgi:hypothetical protein